MKVEVWECDYCGKKILEEDGGIAVKGNINVLNGGGLVGNNFPDKEKFHIDDVKEVHLCPDCILGAILQHVKVGWKERIANSLLVD